MKRKELIIMAKYGKIYIEANTIEEVERDLAMIKALAKAGAVRGQGSSAIGVASAEVVGKPSAPQKPCGTCWCCKGNECDYYEDEDDDFYDELTAEDRVMDILADIEDGSISAKYGAMLISEIVCGEWGA
jgi:hypothetical protein